MARAPVQACKNGAARQEQELHEAYDALVDVERDLKFEQERRGELEDELEAWRSINRLRYPVVEDMDSGAGL